jgi:outer membrane lipoprotein-sorting protein
MHLRHTLVSLCIACGIRLAAPAHQAMAQPVADWGLPQLMQSLSRVKSASARFTERQTLHMLNAPLATSGTLRYTAPDWMQKTTTSPVPERFVLDRGQVTISGGADNQTHVFSVNDYPEIGGLVDGILATLSGNLPLLGRFYVVRLSGSPEAWQLLLQPKDAGLARFIAWMSINGNGNCINVIDTEDSNGDHSDMIIVEDVAYAR